MKLTFLPIVEDDGKIRLAVEPEVSELDTSNTLRVGAVTVPALTVRRTSTTVELKNGESLAIGGLFQHGYSNQLLQVPGLGNIPILSSLFRSTRWQRNETELLIIVTPHIITQGDIDSDKDRTIPGVEPTPADLILHGRALDKAMANDLRGPTDQALAPAQQPEASGSRAPRTSRQSPRTESRRSMSSQPISPPSLKGRRVLAMGEALKGLSQGPLKGARLEFAGLERLVGVGSADAELVIIDADAWEAPELAAGIQALTLCSAAPPILLIGTHLPTSVVRNLLRLARSDVLDAPYSHETIAAAIAGLMLEKAPVAVAPVAGSGVAHCWAVTGAVGGSGATTVAIEIATQLCARQDTEKSVCLIDLNLADGATAAYLGASPAMRLEDLTAAAQRLDASMLQAFVTPVTGQLDLLAASRDPHAFDTVPREAILRMLEIACESYDWVVLDMPRHRRSWSLEALGGCDEVLVVSELTVPAPAGGPFALGRDRGDMGAGEKPKIVLNRVASRMFGPAPSMTEAERALQRKAEGGVSSDWEAAAASVNLGGPISMHRPKSKIVKDIQTLVERLAAGSVRRHATKAA